MKVWPLVVESHSSFRLPASPLRRTAPRGSPPPPQPPPSRAFLERNELIGVDKEHIVAGESRTRRRLRVPLRPFPPPFLLPRFSSSPPPPSLLCPLPLPPLLPIPPLPLSVPLPPPPAFLLSNLAMSFSFAFRPPPLSLWTLRGVEGPEHPPPLPPCPDTQPNPLPHPDGAAAVALTGVLSKEK